MWNPFTKEPLLLWGLQMLATPGPIAAECRKHISTFRYSYGPRQKTLALTLHTQLVYTEQQCILLVTRALLRWTLTRFKRI
jgi:hypothetical protein